MISSLTVPFIIDRFRKKTKKEEIEKGINIELKEIKNRLINNSFQIYSKYGQLDRGLINWLIVNYKSVDSVDNDIKIINKLEQLNELDDQELQQSQIYKAIIQENRNTTLGFKKFSLPFLDIHLNNLSLFDSIFQQKILYIRDRINLINEEIDLVLFFLKKSFDEVSIENSELLKTNSVNSEKKLADWSRQLVDKINALYL